MTSRLHRFHRLELLVGQKNFENLQQAHVAVIGCGGVGGAAVEWLARAGVGKITLMDYDKVCLTNNNRQITCTTSTLGQYKVDVLKERIKDINPKAVVNAVPLFFNEATAHLIFGPEWKDLSGPERAKFPNGEERIRVNYIAKFTPEHKLQDYYNNRATDLAVEAVDVPDIILDAIDNMTAKTLLLRTAYYLNVPIVTVLGAAAKMDPTQIKIGDISQSKICPMAKKVRSMLRKEGIRKGITAVYSTEVPIIPDNLGEAWKSMCICADGKTGLTDCKRSHQIQGTMSYIPPTFGLFALSAIMNQLMETESIDRRRKNYLPEEPNNLLTDSGSGCA